MPAIETHVDDALARFQQTLKDQPNLAAFLTAVVAPVQDIENAMQQLLTERSIDTAVGAQLDDIGAIVGQPRSGLADDVYRRYVRARIMTNRSRGIVEDLIRIARLVVDEAAARMELRQTGTAAYVLRVLEVAIDDDTADALILFLRAASSGGTSGGVRPMIVSSADDPATWFTWGAASPQCWGEGVWTSRRE